MTETAGVPASASETAASLCTSCGLCCDGSLFGRAALEPEEDFEQFGKLLPDRERDGRGFFPQPCAALCGTRCSIYGQRPGVCRDFRCKLLKAVDGDPAMLPAALQTVATTTGLLEELTRLLVAAGFGDATASGAAVRHAFHAAMLRATDARDRDFFQRHGQLVQLWLKSTRMIQRHFYEKAARRAISKSSRGEDGNSDQEESGTLRSSFNG